jgi:hypothetical protein
MAGPTGAQRPATWLSLNVRAHTRRALRRLPNSRVSARRVSTQRNVN